MYFEAWRKLKKNRTAMLGLIIICVAIVISVLGANIRPDATEDVNNQNSPISRKAPGFNVTQLLARKNRVFEDVGFLVNYFLDTRNQYTRIIQCMDTSLRAGISLLKNIQALKRRTNIHLNIRAML